jgi:hypothetical protein
MSGRARNVAAVAASLWLGLGLVVLPGCVDTGEARAAYLEWMRVADEAAIAEGLERELSRMRNPSDEELASLSASLDEAALTSLETYGCTSEELCRHLFRRFDYTVDAIAVTGEETATAEVTLANVDLTAVLESARTRLVSGDGFARLEEGYGTASEVALMRAAMDVIFEEVDTCEDMRTTRLTLGLAKGQDLWRLDDASYRELLSAALGGLAIE